MSSFFTQNEEEFCDKIKMENLQINNPRRNISRNKHDGMRSLGLAIVVLTGFSNFAMPFTIINYYQHKKDYLEANPTEINYSLETAERHARHNAGLLGGFWGCVNIGAALGGLSLMNNGYRGRNEDEK